MKASRLGQPSRASVPAGQSSHWTERTRPPKGSKRKDSRGASTSSGAVSRSKCAPRVCRMNQVAAADDLAFAHATVCSDVYPVASDGNQATTSFLSLAEECPWPGWPEWGSVYRSERGGAGSVSGPPSKFSDSSSSHSDSESVWSSSSSSGSRAQQELEGEASLVRTRYSLWEEFIWGERRPWKRLRHRRSFLTNLWDFKSETKVDESCEPILVSVNVMGSPGPLRLVVDQNDSVQQTIDLALRRYAAQKRQPTLADPTPFFGLYCRNPDFEALDDEAHIGHRSARQFHLYHKHREDIADAHFSGDASSCKSHGTTSWPPLQNWVWSSLNDMGSWAGNVVAGVSQTLLLWLKYLNPWRVSRFVYVASKKAMSLRLS